MKKKTTIARWKLPIIRWAMREVALISWLLPQLTYEGLALLGIEDVHQAGDIFVLPSADKYTPEPLD